MLCRDIYAGERGEITKQTYAHDKAGPNLIRVIAKKANPIEGSKFSWRAKVTE